MSAGWSVTVEFSAATPDDAERLRALVEAMAQAAAGIADVSVEADHPERYARVNLSGEPGATSWLDLGPVYVIGPRAEAMTWASDQGLGRDDWRHVSRAASLYGARGRFVILAGAPDPRIGANGSDALRSVLEQGKASGALVEYGA